MAILDARLRYWNTPIANWNFQKSLHAQSG